MARRFCLGLLVLAGLAGARAQSPPSVADLLDRYAEWIQTGRAGAPIPVVDLEAARSDLAHIAPTFLVPIEGPVSSPKGACPAITFRVAGATVTSDAHTTFAGGSCADVADRASVKVFRRPDAARPAARIVLSQTAASAKSRPAIDEGQRRLLTTFALELAAAGSIRQSASAGRLVEWACQYVRPATAPNEFDRAWQLAALAELEGGIDARALDAHLSHVLPVLPDEPRLALARAVVEEQSTAPAETLAGQAGMVDASRVAYLIKRTNADHLRAAERAVTLFRAAAADDSIRAEASLRLAHVQLGMGQYDDAVASLASVEPATDDRALIYLASLFRGLAFEGLARDADARVSYLRALDLSPGAHSATMRLAALAFRNGQHDDADRLVARLLANDDPLRDAWWGYYAADWRLWYPRIDRVREILRGRSSSAPPDPASVPPRPHVVLARWQTQVFRSRVDAVTIPVAVKTGNRPVAGLVAADFELRDNGVLQQISSISVEDVPLDLTLLLDLSSSVDGSTLQRLKAAVRDTAALLRVDDRVRLIAISHTLHEVFGLQPPGQDLPLNDLSAEGGTSLYDGLAAAMMHSTEPGRRQLVLAFTDGDDSTSIVDAATAGSIARLTDTVVDIVVPVGGAPSAAGAAADVRVLPPLVPGQSPARTNVVSGSPSDLAAQAQALKPWAGSGAAPAVLTDLVTPTSGQVFAFAPTDSISQAFKRTLDDFRATYVLQYVPQGVTPSGWHEVSVTLKKPGKYDVRARNGYAGGPPDRPVVPAPGAGGG